MDKEPISIIELSDDEVINYACAVLEQRVSYLKDREVMQNPADARRFLTLKLATREREVFAVLFLDHRHRLIGYEELFLGTINCAAVHPREVVKAALHHNAAALILAHNHPSGVAEPSEEDKRISHKLKDALALVDIRVLDHIVVGGTDTVSLAERGLL
ncbi:MAG TPA: DNA repair protein RadC [Thiohalobacter sp.]|nr:DNA repair protein RadC [Thiohalobacter sp.]